MNIIDEYSDSIIKNNNKIISKIRIKNLLENVDIQIPSIQRMTHKDKINEIYEYQKEYYIKNKCLNYLGVLNLNYCKEDNKFFLIDGQHRYHSLRKLYDNNINELIFIEILIVETLNDIKNNYELINKNTPLPEFSYDISPEIYKNTLNLFDNKYPDYIEIFSYNIRKCNRPKISRNKFEEALEYIIMKLNINNSIDLFNRIEKINKKISKWNIDNFPKMSQLKNPNKLINTCKEWNFFLGLFPHNNEDYIYDWVKELIYDETGERIGKQKKKRKQTIPKSLKILIWNLYIGEEIGKTKCLCCNNNYIFQSNFEAGHIIAEANGGKVNKDNLMPICSVCNKSMGTMNLDDFKNTHFINYNN